MGRSSIAVLTAAVATAGATALAAAHPQPKLPPPSTQKKSPPPSKPVAGKHSSRSSAWLDQTNGICADGLKGRRLLLDRVRRKPAGSARQTLLEIRSGSVVVESRMLDQLTQVKPSRQPRRRFNAAVSLFRWRHAQDEVLVHALRRHWDAGALERGQRRDDATNARLAKDWSALGSSGCTAYFRALRSR
jgi:hypothetical protein